MLMFSLIILTGISLPWQAFLLFSFCNSLNIFFLSINLKENDSFFHFWIAQKTGSVIWELVILSLGLLSMLRLGTILLKNVLNVSASSSLFLIVLLLSFNVMHSLWKAFSEKRGIVVSQNFLLSVTIFLFKFPKQSLLFLRKILTQRFLCLLQRFFASFVLSRKYLFRSFDLFIMACLKLLVTKLELFARINFCFLGACSSSIDRKISVNSDRSALLKSIFNNSLFNSFSLKYLIIEVFVAPVLNDFWFLFFVENCFYSKSVLKTSWTICKEKIYTWWIIRVFETCWFFKKAK